MKLSKETIERIENDAEMFGRTNKDIVYGYSNGATAEATRYKQETERLKGLIEVLVKQIDRKDSEELGLSYSVFDKQEELAWQEFKTKNNL